MLINKFLKFSYLSLKGNYRPLFILTILSVGSSLISLILPLMSGLFIDDLINSPNLGIVIHYCSLIVIFNILKLILSYVIMLFNVKVQIEASFNLNISLIKKLQKVSILYLQANDIAYLNQRVNNDSNSIVIFIINLIKDVIVNLITLICSIYLLLKINHMIALLFMFILFFYLILYKTIKNKLLYLNRLVLEKQGEYFAKLHDQLGSIRFIKLYNYSNTFSNKLKSKYLEMKSVTIKTQKCLFLITSGEQITLMIVQVLLYIIGGFQIITGNLTIGMFTVLSNYFNNIVSVIKYFANLYQEYLSTFVCYTRIEEIIELENDNEGEKILTHIDKIVLIDLSYSFNDKLVLNNLNLNFEKGKLNLIKGNNGVGKTTLINLLVGLYPNYSGIITYDNLDIKDINLYQTRENCIGIVDQKPLLLNGTVLENLATQDSFNKDIITDYLKKFNFLIDYNLIDDFLNRDINELSSNVSGGEGQKINLIRELLKGRDVIIFDEPTSSLDYDSKKIFINIINELKVDHIIIMITHDDEMNTYADNIIRL